MTEPLAWRNSNGVRDRPAYSVAVSDESNVEAGTESHDPAVPEAYAAFMSTGWGDIALDLPVHPAARLMAARREKLASSFPDQRLVLPAGTYRVRSYDTDYRFRSDTAHTYLCGNQTSDAVLVIDSGVSTLFMRPRSGRDTREFFRDRQYGELWVGRRPSLEEVSESLGIACRHIDELEPLLATGADKTRLLRGVDRRWDSLVSADGGRDEEFARVVSELRLVKDEWEIAQLQAACDATVLGFEDSVREWDRVIEYGERWLEGTFFRRARGHGQRHRLRLHRRGRPPRDHAPLDRQHRADGAWRPGPARHGC